MNTEVIGQAPRPDTPAPTAADTRPATKDAYFSNAKLVLIVLVVIGHSWQPLYPDSPAVRALYMTLYAFHMPAFIMLCGYFSRSFAGKPHQLRRLVTGVVAPYLIFALLYGAMRYFTEDEFNPSLLKPYYLLWFLAALFVWRITAPMWRMVRYPLAVAIVISVGASTMKLPTELDLGRILQFLPFFVAGLLLRREHFEKIRRWSVRLIGPVLCLGLLTLAYFYGGDVHIDWVYYTAGAGQLDTTWYLAIGLKVFMLLAALILSVTFFSWVPDRGLPISKYGELTLYPFLLHGFFIKIAEDGVGWYALPFAQTGAGSAVISVLALLLACVLLSKPVRWLASPLVEPRLGWILKPETPAPAPAAKSAKT